MASASDEYLEVVQSIERVQDQLETLAVRGLRATDASQLAPLRALRDEFTRVGASHLAGRLTTLTEQIANDDRGSAHALLAADSTLRVFERRLTLDVAQSKLQFHLAMQQHLAGETDDDEESEADADDAPAIASSNGHGNSNGNGNGQAAPVLLIAPAERAKLPDSLRRLASGVEELLRSGLTSASDALRQTFEVAFREAARLKLLRLGSTLRATLEELGRFTRSEPEFSKKRMLFFLARSWTLTRMLAQSLESGDEASAARLLFTPPQRPIDELSLVTLGVGKRVARGVSVNFEFRLRTTRDVEGLPAGSTILWSCVFPSPNVNIIPETYLRLDQKQKFKPWSLLEGKEFVVKKAALGLDGFGARRLGLTEQSTLEFGEPFRDWSKLYAWDAVGACEKFAAHRPSPLDVPTELATEVVLRDWKFQEPRAGQREGRQVWPGESPGLQYSADVSAGPDGDALRKSLAEQGTKEPRLPLFGVMHYEMGEAALQPLAVLGPDGPVHLTISNEAVNMKELLKTIKF